MQPLTRLFTVSSFLGVLIILSLTLRPQPALADGPICVTANLAIPDGSGYFIRPTRTPVPIPGQTLTSTLTTSNPATISDLNLTITATHTYVGDLVFTLTHKIGITTTQAVVFKNPLLGQSTKPDTEPACSGDFRENSRSVLLDDEGLYNVQIDCKEGKEPADKINAFINGEAYTPYAALSAFDNKVMSGTWHLSVSDSFAGDAGTLDSWCLVPNSVTQDLQVRKQVFGQLTQGTPLTYTIRFNNRGMQTVSNAAITDAIPTGLTGVNITNAGVTITQTGADPHRWAVQPLAEGQGGVITMTGQIPADMPGGTSLNNTARIGSATAVDVKLSNNESMVTAEVAKPDMKIKKTAGPLVGRAITYTVVYSNTGGPAFNVVLTDTLPAGVTFSPTIPSGWQQVGSTNQYTYSAGVMAQNAVQTRTLRVYLSDPLPPGTANLTNIVTIKDTAAIGADPTPADNTSQAVTTAPKPDLTITKTVTPTIGRPGLPATYRITFGNSGQATAVGVVITDNVPTSLFNLSVTSSGLTITPTGTAPNYRWAVQNMAPGQSGVITITGVVTTAISTDVDVNNTALIGTTSVDSNLANNSSLVTLNVRVPRLIITESGGSTDVTEGGATDTYQVKLATQPISPVTVTLTTTNQVSVLPAQLNFSTSNWNQNQAVTVTAVNDSVYEAAHTGRITHTVTSPDSGYNSLSPVPLAVNITDNDPAPTLSVADMTVNEAAGTASITVTLTGQSALTASVNYSVGGGTATGGGVDYSATNNSFTWLAGQPGSRTITITVVNDLLNEVNETVNITLSSPVNAAITKGTGVLTIKDNDPPAAPTGLTPSGGITITNRRPAMDWTVENEPAIISYTVTITYGGVATSYVTSQSVFTPTTDLSNGTYTWRVRAFDGETPAQFADSAEASFVVQPVPATTYRYIYLPLVVRNN